MEELLKIHPARNKVSVWTKGKKKIEEYYNTPNRRIFKFSYKTHRWWN